VDGDLHRQEPFPVALLDPLLRELHQSARSLEGQALDLENSLRASPDPDLEIANRALGVEGLYAVEVGRHPFELFGSQKFDPVFSGSNWNGLKTPLLRGIGAKRFVSTWNLSGFLK
jgi:hypothetical protein